MSSHSTTSHSTLGESFVSIHETKTESFSSESRTHTHTHELHEKIDTTSESNDEDEEDATLPRRIQLAARQSNLVSNLHTRLTTARFPDQIEGAGWKYGTENSTVKALAREWLHHYNWDSELAQLNSEFEHWTCNVNGLDIHYVRHDPWAAEEEERDEALAGQRTVNDKGEIIMPLLLIHGWPGSWYEFGKVLPLLKQRGRFQIIIPSLPGFGWSQAPSTKGWGTRAMAETLHNLMQQLGYTYYLAQGGDWGAIISRTIATLYPDHCLAVHMNMLPCLPPRPWTRPFGFVKAITGFLLPSVVYRGNAREQASVNGLKLYAAEEGAYFFLQATKPQTLGHALHDSPVGLLSWLTEKYLGWADLDPTRPETWPFTTTELLTQVMIYHSTETITSSIRIYYETTHNKDMAWLLRRPIPEKVPVGVGVWNKELFMVPKAWADDWMNIKSWHEFPKGGHFAAFERPVEFEKEIVGFFTSNDVLDRFTAKRHGFKI
ncbi:hypothetical protein BGZ81_006793 [Podila clonocystis]|nr:hypothetical protein BGZ81_006793 [Podila clonocystis]